MTTPSIRHLFDLDITLRDAALDMENRPTRRMIANAAIGMHVEDNYCSVREANAPLHLSARFGMHLALLERKIIDRGRASLALADVSTQRFRLPPHHPEAEDVLLRISRAGLELVGIIRCIT
ncbi:MAG: hypothetical protein ABS87_14915 [Sphingomonas sp. SCN 67-18]|nr:MAG: hypothetical protein ABS87_14915 [Sphingomonas sp. SCN 67-18]